MWHGFETSETIGQLIARVRDEHGISQLRLAERVCASAGLNTVTRHEISRWEREERLPSGFWLGWLAVALELPLDQCERATAAARRRRLAHVGVLQDWTDQSEDSDVRIAS